MNWRKIFLHRKNTWILLGLLTVLLDWAMSPAFTESYYSRGLFVGVRWLFTAVDSWWPFAAVYVVLALLLYWLVRQRRRILEFLGGFVWQGRGAFAKQGRPWYVRLGRALHSLVAFAAAVVFLFQWVWGFNYGRVPLEQQMGFEPRPLTVEELRDELIMATTEAVRYRAMLAEGPDTVIAKQDLLPNNDAEETMRELLKSVLVEYGYPTPGRVRGRTLLPKGILLRFSTAGVYVPFTGEGHVDAGLHHLQYPFVLAHEMSHAYGHGDEGSCNFLAYLACIRSKDPYLQYIGHLYYWRYVASEYLAMAPDVYEKFKQSLPAGLRADVRAINREMDKYPDILPELRDAAYNTYLQSQGISEGMKNYDRVVMLVAAWRKQRTLPLTPKGEPSSE